MTEYSDIWYFAYGSNIKESQLKERRINPTEFGLGFIENYILKFNKESTDGSGKANIEEKDGYKVWGVFYKISETDYLTLHEKFEKGYDQVHLSGISENKIINSKSFMASPNRIENSLKPTEDYINTIIKGAKEKNLPIDYILLLEEFDSL